MRCSQNTVTTYKPNRVSRCAKLVSQEFAYGVVNTQYFFIGKNPRDASSVTNLAKQMTPGDTPRFIEAYKNATDKPYSFLFVSARQETPDKLRLIKIKSFARPGANMYAYAPR